MMIADFTSTLEVAVDDITNRTNISCVILGNQTHLVIYKTIKKMIFSFVWLFVWFSVGALPPPPYVMVKTENFQPDKFSIIISWESREDEVVDEYRQTNTTTQSITTTNVTHRMYISNSYFLPNRETSITDTDSLQPSFIDYIPGCFYWLAYTEVNSLSSWLLYSYHCYVSI